MTLRYVYVNVHVHVTLANRRDVTPVSLFGTVSGICTIVDKTKIAF